MPNVHNGVQDLVNLPAMKPLLFFCLLACILASCASAKQEGEIIPPPYPIKEYTISSPAFQIYYIRAGAITKPLIVFIHGSPGTAQDFSKYLGDSTLLAHFQMISVDRLGFGGSGLLPVPNLTKQANAVGQVLLKAPSVPVCLVGHSYGGPVALRLALDFPAQVSAVVLLAPAIDPALEKDEWQRPLLKMWLPRHILPNSLLNSNEEISMLKADLTAMEPKLKNIDQPIMHIHGTKDMFVQFANLAYTKRLLTHASYLKTIEIQKANHFIPWTHYDLVKEELLAFAPQWCAFTTK